MYSIERTKHGCVQVTMTEEDWDLTKAALFFLAYPDRILAEDLSRSDLAKQVVDTIYQAS